MGSFNCDGVPRCTIDYSLDISPEEIVFLSGPINTLLKSSYLLGTTFDTESTIESLFDIAEEIAGVEESGFLVIPENSDDNWELRVSRRINPAPPPERMSHLVAPAAIAAHFGKPVSMDPEWGSWAAPICDAWSSRSLISFPLRRDREVVGAIVFGKRESHPFTNIQVKLLWALSMQAENYLHHSGSIKALSYYSFLDPLTHLYNHRFFDNQLDKEILRSRRTGEPFGLLMLSIDDFNKYNEKFPNASGDIALQEFAGILGGCVREVDIVSRLKGDEFAVILLDSNAEGGQALATRILQKFRQHLFPGAEDARTERLSASVGVASFPADSFNKSDLVWKAEQALSIAKARGGGRVCLCHEITGNGRINLPPLELPVQKIFDASRSVVDMDKFLEILLFTGMQGLGARRGSIVVKDPSGNFTLRAAVGFSRHEETVAVDRAFRPGAVTSWVIDHQIPLVVSDPDDSPLQPPQKKNGYSTTSFLSIPLIHAGRTLGAINLTNRTNQRPFTREDLQSFAPIASEIAGILDQGINFRENVRTFALSILGSLSAALELRFPFLAGHSSRVRDLSERIGQRMGMDTVELEALRIAAGLHDVGIVGIPGNLLAMKRRLNDLELEMIRKHPFLGAKLLEGVPGLEPVHRTILEHHENWDGSGYPYGLRGQDISLSARILSIAEYYDSIMSVRPYRVGLSPCDAMSMVRNGANTLFDPDIERTFEEVLSLSPGSKFDIH